MDHKQLGKYEILEEIGSGGMGVVYRARHVTLNRVAAVKAIRERYAASDRHLERFKREAAVCSKLSHPNVIKLFDYGEENGVCFYAMEYIDAETLKEKLTKRSPQSAKFILHVARHLARALSYIHKENVLHRDIKPANIMVGEDQHITLMDFGLVKAFELDGLTQAGKAIGTPRYMSPEMLKAEDTDGRSDIFQMGIVLYEMATGKPPFKGKDVYSIAAKLLSKKPKSPSRLNPRLGIWLDTLIMNCLEKDKEVRYQSADEVLTDIDKCEKRLPIKRLGDETEEESLESKSVEISGGTGRFTLSFSGLDFSTLSTSVYSLRSAFGFKQIFLILLTAACIVGALSYSGVTEERSYSALEMKQETDIDAVSISWRSNSPYPTAINLWPADKPEEKQEVRPGSGPKATTNHNLELTTLKKGVAHYFEVLYPNGKHSLSHSIAPLTYDRITTTSFRVLRPTFSSIKLEFQSNVPTLAKVSFSRRAGLKKVKTGDVRKLKHSCLIGNLSPSERLTDLIIDLHSRRHSQSLSMGHIKSPASAVNHLAQKLKNFDFVNLQNQLRKAKDKQNARDILNRNKLWREFETNRELLSSYMKEWEKLSLVYVYELYQVLRKVDHVDAFLHEARKKFDFNIASTFAPFLPQKYSKQRPPGNGELIFALGEAESSFMTDDKVSGSNTALGLVKVYSAHEKVANKKELTVRKKLAAFLANCSDRPRLVLRSRNMRPGFFVRITLNDEWQLDMRNTAESVPPELYLWDRRTDKKRDESADYRKSVNFISLTFPKAMLRKDLNKFHIKLKAYPGYRTANWIQLRELKLYAK